MSLSVAMDIARSKLAVAADQSAVVSRNIQNASDKTASRKVTNLTTAPGGGVKLASITRVTNASLQANVLTSTSLQSKQQAIVDALDKIETTINDPELDVSPQALLGKVQDALQLYAAAPNDIVRAKSAVAAAQNLVTGLNDATKLVQGIRTESDKDMANAVSNVNTLLGQFKTLNDRIVQGNQTGADVTDTLDQRDHILSQLSSEMGIRTIERTDGDMAVLTDSGVILFDKNPRALEFQGTSNYSAATVGNAVYVDGVPIVGANGPMSISTGRLSGLAKVRDDLAVTYQNQLDEVARGLITAFAEQDQSGNGLPDRAGLFTWPGAPALPPAATVSQGLAGTISVAASVVPEKGGNAFLLRDGGISGDPAYVYNSTGAAGFSSRLDGLITSLTTTQSFDGGAQIDTTTTLSNFAASSGGWFEETRKSASSENEYRQTVLTRASEALNRISGVSIDEEMMSLLDLEKAYNATTKIISTVDQMFGYLVEAIR